MKKMYPVCDNFVNTEILNFESIKIPIFKKDVRAVLTGEFRNPKKGEWYLSGAIPGAWKAFNDLSTKFHICKLVYVRTKIVTEIV